MFEILIPLLSGFGIGNVTGAVTVHFLKRRAGVLKRRAATDQATYRNRSTVLISTTLAAYIRSNRCRDGERAELEELIQDLSEREHRNNFLCPQARRAWTRFLEKSAECGWKRLSGTITEPDIDGYSKARQEWEHAARRSFGPLPEIVERPAMRRGSRRSDSLSEEAA